MLLSTSDGVGLAARWWPEVPGARAAVVLVHGFGASMRDPLLRDVAEEIYAGGSAGIDLLVYDSRGHGESGGLCTLGDSERHDVAAAVAAARERHERVVAVGASMGAISVMRYAVSDPALAGVVVVSCPSQWHLPRSWRGVFYAALTQTALGRMVSARWLKARLGTGWSWPEPPVGLAARLTVPLAVVHGTLDRMVPVAAAHEIYAAAHEPRRLDVVSGMGHAYAAGSGNAIRAAVEWALAHTD